MQSHRTAGRSRGAVVRQKSPDDCLEPIDEFGFSHLSFATDDIHETMKEVIVQGGKSLGEITNFYTIDRPFLIVYMRDCEGNILELEQAPI